MTTSCSASGVGKEHLLASSDKRERKVSKFDLNNQYLLTWNVPQREWEGWIACRMLKSAPSRYLQLFCRTHSEWEMTHFPGFTPTDIRAFLTIIPSLCQQDWEWVFLHEQNVTEFHVGVIKHVVALRLRRMELTRLNIVKQASSLVSFHTH